MDYVRDQALYAEAQERLASTTDITVVSLQKGTFYVKSLASLSVCNQLLINNAQLKKSTTTRSRCCIRASAR
jgi:hypothetical protein